MSLPPCCSLRSTSGHSSGFTTDSPAPESMVISWYRPRLPSVSTSLLSVDTLLIVTVFSSTSSSNHSSHGATSIGNSSDRHTPSLGIAYWRSCKWQMLVVYAQFLTQNKQGSSLRGNLSRWIQTSVLSVPKGPHAAKCQTAHASSPNNRRKKLFAVLAVIAIAMFSKLESLSF